MDETIQAEDIDTSAVTTSEILKPEMPFFVDLITGGVSPKTFAFFGEMETLDSYSFQNVTHPLPSR